MSAHEPPKAEAFVVSLLAKAILSPYYARYVRNLDLKGGERVLDYGSGPGVAARHIATRLAEGGGHLTCVDVSQTWIRIAQKTTRRYSHVEYKLGDIAALDIENDAYDVVFIHFVLHDLPAQKRPDVVRHLSAKLRKGGRLVLREPTSKGHGISPQEIQRLMTDAGLQQVSVKTGRALLIQPVCDGQFHKTV
jgi:2-polyprenyl-3-methyl-5-hydroxy-6-metoxy-1,4-benzoquinol methylase